MSKEAYYDEHIAPKLLALAKECEDNGLSLLAVCEWEPGEYGSTRNLQAGSSFAIRMVDTAAKAQGNVDSFMMAIERHAMKHGHGSMYLHMRGVPETPNAKSQATDAALSRQVACTDGLGVAVPPAPTFEQGD